MLVLIIGIFLVTVVAPIAFWFWFFIWQDRAEPEPKKLLFKTFALSIGVFLFSVWVEGFIDAVFFGSNDLDLLGNAPVLSAALVISVFSAGIIEEFFKYLALKEFIYRRVEFNQIADGIFYAVTLALGFAFIENSLYFSRFYAEASVGTLAIDSLIRGIATTLLHITAAGLIGYGLGKAKFDSGHRKSIIVKYLASAIILHGGFNVIIVFSSGILFAFPLVFLVFLYLLMRLRKIETKLVWRLVTPSKIPEKSL